MILARLGLTFVAVIVAILVLKVINLATGNGALSLALAMIAAFHVLYKTEFRA